MEDFSITGRGVLAYRPMGSFPAIAIVVRSREDHDFFHHES